MILERLDIENVRNIASARITLHPRINLLVGPNGAGKTSALEAIHLLIRGRSFRTTRADLVVRNASAAMAVGATVVDELRGTLRLRYGKQRGGRMELRRDGQGVRQASQVAALVPIQLLLPDLPELVFGAPAVRRQWLDWGVFHVKHEYSGTLGGYLRALRHRNALLRAGDLQTLPAWTAQLAELGEAVNDARQSYFERVRGEVTACLGALNPDLVVELGYFSGWKGNSLAELLGQQHARDVKLGATQAGPHRADVSITYESDAAAQVLSRGQGKAVASALRLGQAKDLARTGKPSLFLIDDLGAELDERHNERYYGLLGELDCQIVATSTQGAIGDVLMRSRQGCTFHVKQGRFEQAARATGN